MTSNNVPIFARGDKGKIFSQAIDDTISPYSSEPLDLTGYDSVYLVFYPPDGKSFSKEAEPEDDSNLEDTAVTYTDDAGDATAQSGPWEYAAKVVYADNSSIESSRRAIYFVQ